ncbi:MAG: YwaF family protein [Bacilli bacterium]|nr:YwaF family protein [Bacilli bacterium]
MFDNDFSPDEVIGLFNYIHYIIIFVYILLATILAFLASKLSEKTTKIIINSCGIFCIIAELIKLHFNVTVNQIPILSVQLSFCTLFMYAFVLWHFKNKHLSNTGLAYLGTGAIIGAIFYIFIPNGSIDLFPIYHIKTIHGILYHFIMLFTGLLILFKGIFIPKVKYFINYIVFIIFFSLIGIYLNKYHGNNALFLAGTDSSTILMNIRNKSHFLYMLLVFIGEGILAYWIVYGLYHLIKKIFKYIEKKHISKMN